MDALGGFEAWIMFSKIVRLNLIMHRLFNMKLYLQ